MMYNFLFMQIAFQKADPRQSVPYILMQGECFHTIAGGIMSSISKMTALLWTEYSHQK